MRKRYPPWLQMMLIVIVPVLLFLLAYVNFRFVSQAPRGNDFFVGWTATKSYLQQGISPYDPQIRSAVQRVIYGRPANLEAGEFSGHFLYPFPAIGLYAPFTLFPFDMARAIWMTLLEIGAILLVVFGHRLAKWTPHWTILIGLFLFSLVWYHGARSILMGSLSVIEAILIVGSLVAVQRGYDWIAGICIAMAFIQPLLSAVMILTLGVWAISVRRWQLLFATIGFTLLVLVLSVLLLPSWPFEWIQQSVNLIEMERFSSVNVIVAGVFPEFEPWLPLILPVVLGVLLLGEWIQVWGKDVDWFIWTASLTIALSMLILPHASTGEYTVLLPFMVMLFGHWVGRWGSAARLVSLLCILSLGAGLWFLFFSSPSTPNDHSGLYFPVPLFTIFGLYWVRWWVTRRHRRIAGSKLVR